jgi:hypothetical protein
MQSDTDPYLVDLIRFELQANRNGQKFITSWGQKGLARMGDRASVSILKVADPNSLKDPATVESCLTLIQRAFVQPDAISLEIDKDPRVTRFLLEYFRREVADPEIQKAIRIIEASLPPGKQ